MTSENKLSQCLPKFENKVGQSINYHNGERQRGYTPRHILRVQILLALLACGPLNKNQLATIIASHTKRKPESVRKALAKDRRVLEPLEELWLLEKDEKSNNYRITPLGIRAIRNTIPMANILYDQIAARLEEWEPSLKGLSCIIQSRDGNTLDEPGLDNYPLGDRLFYLMNSVAETLGISKKLQPKFEGSSGHEILRSLLDVFFPYTIQYVLEALKDLKRVPNDSELHSWLEQHINKILNNINLKAELIYRSLHKCRQSTCTPEEEKAIEDLFESGDEKGLLIELAPFKREFIEQVTEWADGIPPLRSRLALRMAGIILRDLEVEYIIEKLSSCKGKISELLTSLLSLHSMNRVVLDLENAYTGLEALARHMDTITVSFMNLRSSELRQTLAFLVLLRDVLIKFREYWINTIKELKY